MNRRGLYRFPGHRGSEEGPSSPSPCESSPESPTSRASPSCSPKCVDRDLFPNLPRHQSSIMTNAQGNNRSTTSTFFFQARHVKTFPGLSSPLSSLAHRPVCVSYVHVSPLPFPSPHHYTPSSSPPQGSTAPSSTHSHLRNRNPSIDGFNLPSKKKEIQIPTKWMGMNRMEADPGTAPAAQPRRTGRRCGRGRAQHK